MHFDSWLTYVIAYAVVSIIPGPSVLMIVGQALSRGKRAAMACIFGDLIGGIFVMTASYLGLGLILASSALAFAVMKWVGVAYMAYLGLSQIVAAKNISEIELPIRPSARGSLGAGFLTGVLNPKAIMFYMAFLAQFIDPAAAQLPQFLILMASSTAVVALVLGGYALMAARISDCLKGVKARKRLGYAGGTFLLGGSAVMAATR